jgi:voltage-gated potassium channel
MSKSTYLKAEKFFEVPVMISVIMLIPVIVIENSDSSLLGVANNLNWVIWIVFLLEYGTLFYLSENKIGYIKNHKIELFIVIASIPFVPQGFETSRFLRFIRLPRLLKLFQLFRLAAVLSKFGIAIKTIFRSRGLQFIVYATCFLIVFFGFLFYVSEPQVNSFSDGIWWALVTITTVGYGDITPLTSLGRVVASTLMIIGIGFIATITAAVSSYFLSNFGEEETTLGDLAKKLDKIEQDLNKLKGQK